MFESVGLDRLIKIIAQWNESYWKDGISNVTDYRYDAAIRELSQRIPAHELIQRINTPFVSSKDKIKHPEAMLSLNKAYSLNEIINWAKSIARDSKEKFIIQPKYDGIAGRWDGKNLSTRGDGFEGEIITDKVDIIIARIAHYDDSIPLSFIRTNNDILGEIVITKSEFATWKGRVQKQDGSEYKNSRNAIAGVVGLNDITEIKKMNPVLCFVDYNYHRSPALTLEDLEVYWNGMLATFEKLDYPMDGLVVKLLDKEYYNELGNTQHHPKGAIAYKFANQTAQTKLLDIEWSFGKNCLTPVAIIEETEINGIKINRATLHNLQNIIDNDIQIGDTLELERAGDVIPYIRSSSPGEKRRSGVIDKCPCCEYKLDQRSVELCCPNEDCKGTLLENIYASVKTLGIDELGRPTIAKIIEKYNVENMLDIYHISADELLRLPGFAEKSASTLWRNLYNSIKNTPERILASLNIPLVGVGVSKKLLENMTLLELLEASRNAFENIPGIGEERINSIRKFIKRNNEYIRDYFAIFEISTKTAISSKTICFTGKMPMPRKKYEEMAKEAGFCPVDGVDKSLGLLVVSDESEILSSKMIKAKKYNIQIIELSQWLKEIKK